MIMIILVIIGIGASYGFYLFMKAVRNEIEKERRFREQQDRFRQQEKGE